MTKDLLQNINICKNKIIEINNPVDLERIEKKKLEEQVFLLGRKNIYLY